MDISNFKEVVAEYIGYDHASGVFNKDKARELANKFTMMPSTAERWASGATCPHPLIQQVVIKYILKQNTGV